MTKDQEPTGATLKPTWRNAPTQTINAGDVQFAYRQLGQSTGVPVVFLTTWPRSWTTGTRESWTASPPSIG
jgi:hypothetical protein